MDLNGAVIDVAAIDKEHFCGYEIKSDKDSFKRLPGQIKIYNYVLDEITIVVGISKLSNVDKIIPNFWGIVVARKKGNKIILIGVRIPKLNKNININWLSKKLWRSDIVDILKTKNLYKGRSHHYKDDLLKILMENISLNELRYYIRDVLTKRKY